MKDKTINFFGNLKNPQDEKALRKLAIQIIRSDEIFIEKSDDGTLLVSGMNAELIPILEIVFENVDCERFSFSASKNAGMGLIENLASVKKILKKPILLDLSKSFGITGISKIKIEKLHDVLTNLPVYCLKLSRTGFFNYDIIGLIEKILKENTTLEELYLDGNWIDDDEVEKIAKALKMNQSLKKLDLSKNEIEDEGLVKFVKLLIKNSSLESIDLSHNKIGMLRVGPWKEWLKILNQPRSISLKLNLDYNEIGEDRKKIFQSFIKSGLNGSSILVSLDFQKCDQVIEEMKKQIREGKLIIDGMGSKIGDEGVIKLTRELQNGVALRIVDLSKNQIRDKGAIELAKALKYCVALRIVDLSENQIGDRGTIELAKALKYCVDLEILDLSENQIGDKGAINLAKELRCCVALEKLYISENQIGSKGATELEYLAQTLKLEKIDLDGNPFEDKDWEFL